MATTKGMTLLRAEAPPELRRRIKVRAAERGVAMQRYVREAVEEKLAKEDKRRKR